jgi:hypothetical protein
MATSNLVKTTQVSETRSADLAPVWPLATVTDQENSHLTLRSLDGGVSLTRRNGVTLGVEKEVVDKGLHVFLHSSTRRGHDLVVLDADGAGRHLIQALVNDAEGLAKLLHAAEVAVIAVAVDTDRDIELDLVVGIVGLGLTDIPGNTRAAEHNTSEAHVKRIGGADNTNALGSSLPDTVVREQFFGFVDAVTKLSSPLVDIIQEAKREILGDTTGSDVGGVETGTRYSLVKFLVKQFISKLQQ